LSSFGDPSNVTQAVELLVGILRRKGAPEALKEAEELEGVLEGWRGDMERWKSAFAKAKDMAARGRGARKGGQESKRGKKKGPGKGKGGSGRGTQRGRRAGADAVEGLTAAMGSLLDARIICETSLATASAAALAAGTDGGGQQEEAGEGDKGEEQGEECAICLLPLGQDDDEGDGADEIATLGCGHVFHEGCMESWVVAAAQHQLDAQCPMCRGSLDR
jgi:hypothetical protein